MDRTGEKKKKSDPNVRGSQTLDCGLLSSLNLAKWGEYNLDEIMGDHFYKRDDGKPSCLLPTRVTISNLKIDFNSYKTKKLFNQTRHSFKNQEKKTIY